MEMKKWYHKQLYAIKVFLTPRTGACTDIPDNNRDYVASAPSFKGRLPKEVNNLKKADDLYLNRVKQSKNACTAFGNANDVNITNMIETGTIAQFNSFEQWSHQLKTGGSVESGDRLQNAYKTRIENDQGYPSTEYKRIDHPNLDLSENEIIHRVKVWTALGRNVCTGCFWRYVDIPGRKYVTNYTILKETGVFHRGSGKVLGAHFIIIVGYSEEKKAFRVYESELTKTPLGDGEFWLPYGELRNLMSLTVFMDCKSN